MFFDFMMGWVCAPPFAPAVPSDTVVRKSLGQRSKTFSANFLAAKFLPRVGAGLPEIGMDLETGASRGRIDQPPVENGRADEETTRARAGLGAAAPLRRGCEPGGENTCLVRGRVAL